MSAHRVRPLRGHERRANPSCTGLMWARAMLEQWRRAICTSSSVHVRPALAARPSTRVRIGTRAIRIRSVTPAYPESALVSTESPTSEHPLVVARPPPPRRRSPLSLHRDRRLDRRARRRRLVGDQAAGADSSRTPPAEIAALVGAIALYALATVVRAERWQRLLEDEGAHPPRADTYALTVDRLHGQQRAARARRRRDPRRADGAARRRRPSAPWSARWSPSGCSTSPCSSCCSWSSATACSARSAAARSS